ncbi:AAA family ATPase [Staphylococcus sp. 17KM0847]|uniref:AAA family ATPase n=1 Tax=Staphylococcus sp. 17KM0847 TaxID=2583989 RepID=UPI0015DD0C44|nr:SMC family ATPase [Staphylococcus sp. 17KM0847]QLK86230.1 SMC family ATPase [Staphylococcus sp. 17KM0847]
MKPIRLQLENFGPFLNEEIDFAQIQSNQLFLISGKTGSGKTMIFDGIVYALYGRASTEKREVKYLRSHFADAQSPLKVTFEFEIGTQRYKVIRTAPYQKLGNKGETQSTLEVYHYEEGRYILKEGTTRDGDKFLLDIIKLKHDQFRQLFILPQGEFKKFLMSKTSDKQPILRTLFSTGIYEKLRLQLYDKTKNIKTEIEKQHIKIKSTWQKLATFDVRELMTYQALEPQQYKQLLEVASQYIEIGNTKVKQLNDEKQKIYQSLQEIKFEKEKQQQRIELEEKQRHLVQVKAELNMKNEEMEILEQQLKRITESKLAIKLYEDLTLEREQLEDKQQQIERTKQDMNQLLAEHKVLEQNKKVLVQENEKIEKQKIFIQNTYYYYQNADLYKEKQKNIQHIDEQLVRINQQLKEKNIEYEQLKQRISGKVVDMTQERTLIDICQSLKREVEQLEHNREQVQNAEDLQEKISQLHQEIIAIDEHIAKNIQQQYKMTAHDHAILNHEQAVQSLRDHLTVGSPCPVCNQVVHKEDVEARSIDELKIYQTENKKLEQQINEYRLLKVRKETSLKHYKEVYQNVSSVTFDAEELSEKLKLLHSKEAALNQIRECNKWLDTENQRLIEIQKEVMKFEQEQEIKTQQQLANRTAIEELYTKTGYTDIALFVENYEIQLKAQEQFDFKVSQNNEDMQRNILMRTRIQQQLEMLRTHIEQSKDSIIQAAQDLDYELQKLQLEDEKELIRLKEMAHQTEQIKQKVDAYFDHVKLNREKIKEVQEHLKLIEVKDIKQLNDKYDECEEMYNESVKVYNQVELKVRENKQYIEEVQLQIQYLQNTLETQSELVTLSEVVSGHNHKKLTLENYVLTYYLDQILECANRRLQAMTGHRYQLVRKEDITGKGFSGLDIDVFDYYANQTRPINSLSGGETFQASLALALGLCEIVQNEQGGISLDAMFIDEGFGTLDQETLETALETLIQLQSSGRLVGMISHVTELKDRIPVILEVISNNDQSTTRMQFKE